MGDGGGPNPAIYSGTPGAIYPQGSAGIKAKLADWQKVNSLGQVSRQNRDAFIQSYDAGNPNPSLINLDPSARNADVYGSVKAANAYEDQLTAQYNTLKESDDAVARAAQLKADAVNNTQRNNDLARAQAVEGGQTVANPTGRASPIALPNSILSAPLGIPGGYLTKTVLGS